MFYLIGPESDREFCLYWTLEMGYEILYCKSCQSQVRGADLEKGLAVKVDGYPYCPACARSLPQERPPTPSGSGTRRIPVRRGSSDKIPKIHLPPRAQPANPLPMVLGLCAAGAGLIVLLALAFSGGSTAPAPTPVEPPPTRAAAPAPPPVARPPEGPSPAQVVADLEKAAAAPDANLTDLLFRCEQARKQLQGTPEASKLLAIEERAKARLKETGRDRQVDSALEELARIRKDDPRFRRRGDTIALLEAARKIAGSRTSDIDRALADYIRDADAYLAEFGGIAAWYRFDNGARLAADATTFERHGTASGARWLAEDGPRKGVLRLEGQAELLLPVPAREDFSVAFWMRSRAEVRPGNHWHEGMGIVDAEMPGNAADFGVALLNGKLAFGIGGMPDITLRSTSSVVDDRWRHVAVTYRAETGDMRVYVGGAKEVEGRGPAGARTAPDAISVGRLRTGHNRFEGSLDDLRFYSRALTDAEVKLLSTK